MAMPNKNPIPEPMLREKIREMAQTMDEFTIADRTGLNVKYIATILGSGARSRQWCAKCLRTGRTVTSFSERGAYLRAQIAGFADWCFVEVRA